MRRLMGIVIILSSFFICTNVFAAWTLTATNIGVSGGGHIHRWQVVCTSDGSALSATDLVPYMDFTLRDLVKQSLFMVLDVVPGTGGVIPDTTINITLSNDDSHTLYATTGVSKDAQTMGNDLSEDYGQYWTVFEKLYLTLNDIGSAGDQVTLIFTSWIE